MCLKIFYLLSAPPAPEVVIIADGSSTAGQSHTLTCSASVLSNLTEHTISYMWEGGQDGPILTFSPLLTSHGGAYTCTARLDILDAEVDVSGNEMTTVNVRSM